MPKASNSNIKLKRSQIKELEKEIKQLQKLSKKRLTATSKEIKALVRQIKALSKKSGMTSQDIASLISSGVGTKTARKAPAVKKARKKVPPKYKDPKNESNLWTGRGRKPKWVEGHLNNGGTLNELLITPLNHTLT